MFAATVRRANVMDTVLPKEPSSCPSSSRYPAAAQSTVPALVTSTKSFTECPGARKNFSKDLPAACAAHPYFGELPSHCRCKLGELDSYAHLA
ncbi:hypothetical protein RUND412_010582 [Rhizina undulata]